VNFKNTVIIMTSNIASVEIRGISGLGFTADNAQSNYDSIKDKVLSEVRRFFRPEFLNRVDEVIVFRPLDREQMEAIVEIQLRDLVERLRERKLTISLTQSARDLLVQEGFDPQYGARPIKRALRRLLEDPLSEELLRNRFSEGATIQVDRDGDRLVFRESQPAAPGPD
jgi:ATP-dependent Clp protease ATP-binding subunit ClpC